MVLPRVLSIFLLISGVSTHFTNIEFSSSDENLEDGVHDNVRIRGGGQLSSSNRNLQLIQSNNNCTNALEIVYDSTTISSTIGVDVDENRSTLQFKCGNGPYTAHLADAIPRLWYKVSGTGDTFRATVCNTASTRKIFVFEGGCGAPGFELKCLAVDQGNPQSDNCAGFNWVSVKDKTYYILVESNGETGSFFDLEVGSAGTALCQSAEEVTVVTDSGKTAITTTRNAFNADEYKDSVAFTCGSTNGVFGASGKRWYKIVGDGRNYTATHLLRSTNTASLSSGWNARTFVFSGSCGIPGINELQCQGFSTGTGQASLSWESIAGETYYIVVETGGGIVLAKDVWGKPNRWSTDTDYAGYNSVLFEAMGESSLATSPVPPPPPTSNPPPDQILGLVSLPISARDIGGQPESDSTRRNLRFTGPSQAPRATMSYGGPDFHSGYVVLRDGNIVGLTVALSEPLTQGEVHFYFQVNGGVASNEALYFTAQDEGSIKILELAEKIPIFAGDLVAVGVRESCFEDDTDTLEPLLPMGNRAGILMTIEY